jgi:non-ribosomal peptide synthetase component E (peptide arylation enzyme)
MGPQYAHTLWVMPNLVHLLRRSAAAHAERVAIKIDDRGLSYSQLDAAAARVAGLLRAKGMQPGDRVGIMLPNVPYFAAEQRADEQSVGAADEHAERSADDPEEQVDEPS